MNTTVCILNKCTFTYVNLNNYNTFFLSIKVLKMLDKLTMKTTFNPITQKWSLFVLFLVLLYLYICVCICFHLIISHTFYFRTIG